VKLMLNSVGNVEDSISKAEYRVAVGRDWMLIVDKGNWS